MREEMQTVYLMQYRSRTPIFRDPWRMKKWPRTLRGNEDIREKTVQCQRNQRADLGDMLLEQLETVSIGTSIHILDMVTRKTERT